MPVYMGKLIHKYWRRIIQFDEDEGCLGFGSRKNICITIEDIICGIIFLFQFQLSIAGLNQAGINLI